MPRVFDHVQTSNARRREEDGGLAKLHAEFEDNQRGKPLKALIGLGILVIVALVMARIDRSHHIPAPAPSAVTDSSGVQGHTVGRAPVPRGN